VLIETPLLIVGGGAGALVAARIASAHSLTSLVAGHVPTDDETPVSLTADSVTAMGDSLGVLRPYLASTEPPTIAPSVFERVLKHHCVADMNVTVYDGMKLLDPRVAEDGGVRGVLVESRSRFDVVGDAFLDASTLPTNLNQAIAAASTAVQQILGADR